MPPERPGPLLGWDLGGAHLKAARLDAEGRVEAALQLACPLWQGLEHLQQGLAAAMRSLGEGMHGHALTMTGELVDLFSDREQGVRQILDCVEQGLAGTPVRVFAGRSGFLDLPAARRSVPDVASANWLATGELAARQLGEGLLIDVGSTTTDFVPFSGGVVTARGRDDHTRMRHGELLYTGLTRTPLMALTGQAPFDGEWLPLMAEHFATTADVYRLLGELEEAADLLPSADSGDKTQSGSERRLARMLGLDADCHNTAQWRALAAYFADCQIQTLCNNLHRLNSRPGADEGPPLVGAGAGRNLVRRLAVLFGRDYVDFDVLLPLARPEVAAAAATCAPAVAVAWLAAQPDALSRTG